MLTIALPKGRLEDQTLDIMEKAGYDVSAAREKSRKLILEDKDAGLRFILSKPSDVPTYVEYGAADIGVVGKDTLLEEGRQLYEVLDLGLGKCRMCVAGPAELKEKLDEIPNKRVLPDSTISTMTSANPVSGASSTDPLSFMISTLSFLTPSK